MPSPPPKTTIKWNMDRRIYIGNMGDGANKEEILDVCSKFGAVKHVWVARKPAGFAFVEFFAKRAAEEATHELDETWINGHKVCVEMSTGEPKFTADGRPRVGNGVRRSPTLSPTQVDQRQRHNQDNRRTQTSRTNRDKRSSQDEYCRDSSCACHCHCSVGRRIPQGSRTRGSLIRNFERQTRNGDRASRQDSARPRAYRSRSRSHSRSAGRRSRPRSRHSDDSDDRSSRSKSRDNQYGRRRSWTPSYDRSQFRPETNVLEERNDDQ